MNEKLIQITEVLKLAFSRLIQDTLWAMTDEELICILTKQITEQERKYIIANGFVWQTANGMRFYSLGVDVFQVKIKD